MTTTLIIVILMLACASVFFSARKVTVEGFFAGEAMDGSKPSLLTLVFSQVTTWIFARSLLTAAILGFYYGIGGALAYTAYYLSFFTGAFIVDHIRFKHGFHSVQDFLTDNFGATGTSAYNFVIGLRLLSEVFANLIVVGIVFGADFHTRIFDDRWHAFISSNGCVSIERFFGDANCTDDRIIGRS